MSGVGGGNWEGGREEVSVAEVNGRREEGSGHVLLWLFWSSAKCLRAGAVTKPELPLEGSLGWGWGRISLRALFWTELLTLHGAPGIYGA